MIPFAAALTLGAAFASSVTAQVPAAVATDSAVYVERIDPDASRRLEPARQLAPGDRVVTVVRWFRMGGDGGFVITNPLPASLAYEKSASNMQEVSVDGGRTWGRLENLRIDGHEAVPEDVTHVRWRIPAGRAARGRGEIAYAGIVR
ncbi:hypothetical protein [Novosphingobium album (ex Hu et al. 2023)]|uniref:Uncharacterized protein n=1 Tax=Novosphingobium album (ex Hu et al. 2023) TaxID=2930093 RepID=A0ABT0AX56_9SPHN|nr:hypothetical protein [Novosphingobium album (ex Hu et al. 2023)]MCJ2177385.1 hypothetical protein [Novosphingobium album (ex Hu et al. 2023)]